MPLKTAVSGQLNLVNESTGANFLSFNLADAFPALTAIAEQTYIERQLVVGDGAVTLDKGGIETIRMFMLIVTGNDPVTVKHNGNSAGIVVDKALLLQGTIDNIIVQTAATQPLTVKYLMVE